MRKVGKFTESVARILEADETPELLTEEQAEDIVTAIFAEEKSLQKLRREVPEVLEKSDRFIFEYKLYVEPDSQYALIFKNLFCKITVHKGQAKNTKYGASIKFDYEHPDGRGNGISSYRYAFDKNLKFVEKYY